jgi:hypothetical protein
MIEKQAAQRKEAISLAAAAKVVDALNAAAPK